VAEHEEVQILHQHERGGQTTKLESPTIHGSMKSGSQCASGRNDHHSMDNIADSIDNRQ
jgi:hypothetical protein